VGEGSGGTVEKKERKGGKGGGEGGARGSTKAGLCGKSRVNGKTLARGDN